MAKGATDKGKRTLFTVHRKDLLLQTARTFDSFNLQYGFIAAGYPALPQHPVQIASIETLKNRYDKIMKPDLLVIDEAHLSAAKGWKTLIQHYKSIGCKIIGLTATPWRLSGDGLDDIYDTMVKGPSTDWLIKNGYLSDYKIYAPEMPDLSGVHSKMGDYVNSELNTAMDKPSITGDAVSHYVRYANNKRALAFCVSIAHSQHVAQQFKEAGIMAQHIDGETPHEMRKKAFNAFADGHIKVITSVAIFCEGFDLSSQVGREVPIEAVILLRPTQSLTLFLQQIGRGLRRKPYPAIILDHSGNTVLRHGLPDDDRNWTLAGREKTRKGVKPETSVRTCPTCFAVMRSGVMACEYCKHIFEVKGREVGEREGILVEVDKEVVRRQKKIEQGKAKDLRGLIELGKQRGYKNPYAWSRYVLQAREKLNRKQVNGG